MPTQAERTEATRGRLIATARRLFAEKGFAATSTEEILGEAEVEPRRPVPPLPEQDRPVPGGLRSGRGRADRAGARGRHGRRRDRPDAHPGTRLRRVLGPVRQSRGAAHRDARRPDRARVGHLARARRALRVRHDQGGADGGGRDRAHRASRRSIRSRTSSSARSCRRAWSSHAPTTRSRRSRRWRARSRGSSPRSELGIAAPTARRRRSPSSR